MLANCRDIEGARDERASIRPCGAPELSTMLMIINQAAQVYEGAIPADRWHSPYMSEWELEQEIAAGVAFVGYQRNGELVAVMGIQPVSNVDLIRHAYVLPAFQGLGIGGRLMSYLCDRSNRQILVGTWAAATWATAFYERHGFRLTDRETKNLLLQTYWTVPAEQIDASVVLARPALTHETAIRLIEEAGVPLR